MSLNHKIKRDFVITPPLCFDSKEWVFETTVSVLGFQAHDQDSYQILGINQFNDENNSFLFYPLKPSFVTTILNMINNVGVDVVI